MLRSITIRKTPPRLQLKTINRLVTHKFYYGQGGQLTFDLTKRTYSIQLKTFWEDYCLLEVQGLTGPNSFLLSEEEGKGHFADHDLIEKLDERIEVKLSIPEDYTLKGTIFGDLKHIEGEVGRKMRSNPFSLTLLGEGHCLSLGDVKAEAVNITNHLGKVEVSSLTVQQGQIAASSISSKKLMTSSSIHLNAADIHLRSILMFGKARGFLEAQSIKIESLSGYSQISANTVNIDRIYAGIDDIHLKCHTILDKIGVETGTGTIQFKTDSQASSSGSKVILGRLHKGATLINGSKIQIT